MQHRIDWAAPAKLVRADHVTQFGDGYRQISGPTVATGSVDELLTLAKAWPQREASKAYILNDGGVPLTIDEIESQRA